MTRTKCFAGAVMLAVCAGNVPAANAAAPAKPEKDALVNLETKAYEALKSKDTKFWDNFLSERFVGYGSSGKLDKASATTEYTAADCDIKSYALSDEHMTAIGTQAALLTYSMLPFEGHRSMSKRAMRGNGPRSLFTDRYSQIGVLWSA